MKKTKNEERSKIDIKHVAKLANLPITVAEEKTFKTQLSKIIGYIDQIEKGVDTKNVEPTFNVSPNSNVKRPDVAEESLSQKDAIKNSKNTKDGFFETKGIFENE